MYLQLHSTIYNSLYMLMYLNYMVVLVTALTDRYT